FYLQIQTPFFQSLNVLLKYFLICLVSLYFNVCPVLILGYTYSLIFIARAVNDLGNVSRARMRKSETGNTKTGPQA
ncbi:hypothetical protein, partial [Duodenibacillus massiliensis]|uniref:hypothetical protein n=1 Tax=Duodenibacillus massiliensis TaxID=1852381 RepID=UPI00307709E5